MALAARRVFERFGDIVGGDASFRRTGFLVLGGRLTRPSVQIRPMM